MRWLLNNGPIWRGGIRNGGAASSAWEPAHEMATGNYAWEGIASDFDGTMLPDHNGGPITLTQRSTGVPTLVPDAGDGMPVLRFTAENGSEHISYESPLTLEAETFFYLLKPSAVTQGWFAVWHMGYNQGSFQLQGGTAGGFYGHLVATDPFPSIYPSTPQTNFAGRWMTGVVEIDPANSRVRHWINGVFSGSGIYAPGGAYVAQRFALGAARALSGSARMDFAHGIVLHGVSDDLRAKGIAYLKRRWSSRVQGW